MRAAVVGVVGVLVLCVACTASQAYVATGEGLVTLGNEFVVTAEAMNAGIDAHRVTEQQYDAWRAFALRFKAVYPGACRLYRTALDKSDHSQRDQAAALLTGLSAELAIWSANAASSRDGGAP